MIFQILGAIFGAAAGSFLGVVIDRSDWEVSQTSHSGKFAKLRGRSRCGSCRRQLSWRENIPLVSFILLRGKCRTCRSPIPYWLPLIELAGAAAGAAVAAQIGLILVATALVWIFFSDLVKGVVPDWAVVLGSAGAIVEKFAKLPITLESFANFSAPAIAAALFFWLLVFVTRGRGMGAGDITLAFFLGLWLGWPKIIVGIWLAFLLGAAVALGLISSGRKKFGQTVPFGPFLIVGSIIAKLWGSNLLELFLTI